MHINFLYENLAHAPEITYAFRSLASILGASASCLPYHEGTATNLPEGEITISYGAVRPAFARAPQVHIYESRLFGAGYLTKESLPRPPIVKYKGIPVIYQGLADLADWVVTRDGLIETTLDVVASACYMLTCYEDIVAPRLDHLGRATPSSNIAYREEFLHVPVVNAYAEMLGEWAERLGVSLQSRVDRWNGHRMAVALTCDVDHLRWFDSVRSVVGPLVRATRRGRWPLVAKIARSYVLTRAGLERDPYDNLRDAQHLAGSLGFAVTYFMRTDFETEQREIPPVRYDVNAPSTRWQLLALQQGGGEIGLHPGANTFVDVGKLLRQKDRLERALSITVSGARQHYLQWRAPTTSRHYESAGLLYDASVGYPYVEGFRCGTCTPVRAFDALARRELDVWLLPLALMETSLLYERVGSDQIRGEDLDPDSAFARAVRLVDEVERFGGVFVPLWHNTSFDASSQPEMLAVYVKLLNCLTNKNPFASTCHEIVGLWQRKCEVISESHT